MKLNLACGNRKLEGFTNVDMMEQCKPDLVFDLCDRRRQWPWQDNTIEEVKIIHGLEHMGQDIRDFYHFLHQLYRVCKSGSTIEIIVPHPRSDGYWGDPTHVRPINVNIMRLFSKKVCREARESGFPNTPLAEYIDVDFDVIHHSYSYMPDWHKELVDKKITEEELFAAAQAYWNVIAEINIILRVVK